MVNAADLAAWLRMGIDWEFVWRLVRENRRSCPLRRTDIDVRVETNKVLFGVVDDAGFDVLCVRSLVEDKNDLLMDLSSSLSESIETVRLVPRTSARALSLNVDLARLEQANLIGEAIIELFPDYKLLRIALN